MNLLEALNDMTREIDIKIQEVNQKNVHKYASLARIREGNGNTIQIGIGDLI